MDLLKKTALLLAVCPLLSACMASTPANLERYTLTNDVAPKVFTLSRPEVNVSLTPILASGGVVMEVSDVTLRPAKNHRYSFDLDHELKLLVMSEFLKNGLPDSCSADVFISAFQGTTSGRAKVSAFVKIKNSKGKILFEKEMFRDEPLSGSGYDSLVAQLKDQYLSVIDEAVAGAKEKLK